jgi:radical SAM family RiPP maturation amino acid epimerase
MNALQVPEIVSVLVDRSRVPAEYRADLGRSKRFLERYVADHEFREECAKDPVQACARWNLESDPEELRPLWDAKPDRSCLGTLLADPKQPRSLLRYIAFLREKSQLVKQMRSEGAPAHPVFRAWRQRQIERCISELPGGKGYGLVHAPFVVELGVGCSVGCWFCAVSAPKLGDQWAYNSSSASLWRDCLSVMQELVGEKAARWGYCYWGTDPLDNPDYESFLLDFHSLIGSWPQTTTAQAHKHVERVKALLSMGETRGALIDRFSVITLRQWQELHEAFTPSEMTYVECPAQNKESLEAKCISGRALQANRKLAAKGREPLVDPRQTSTIACVSGFLLNMVTKQVSLITPCNASARHPDGFWTLGSRTFSDALDLQRGVLELIEQCMDVAVSHDRPVAFRSDLQYSSLTDGFSVTSHASRKSLVGSPHLADLGALIQAGGQTAGDIAAILAERHGVSLETCFHSLNKLYDAGLLEEDPQATQKRKDEEI